MEKEKSEKETEDQKLDRLNYQMEDMKSQFRQLLQALKGGTLNLDAESVASFSTIDGGETSKFNSLKKSKSKGYMDGGEKLSRRNTRRGLFESLEDALVNPTASIKKIKNMERSNTLDDDK